MRVLLGLLRAVVPAAMLLVATTRPIASQVRGVVVDGSRQPVAGATVELWVAQRRAAAAESSADGAFELAATQVHGPMTVSIRRLGFRTKTIDVVNPDTTLFIQMEIQPLALAPLVVESSTRQICPNREEPRARALWERMRSRYWQEHMDTLVVFALVEFRTGMGSRTETDHLRTAVGWTQGPIAASVSRYLPRSGYAEAVSSSLGERYASWMYRSLDDGGKQDFTQAYFGSQHTLSIVHASPSRTVIGFCPRQQLGQTGQIDGTLVIGADTTLKEARWNFRTRRPVEDAGGQAAYYPPDPRMGSALLAEESSYWRRTANGADYVENRTYTGWRVLGAVP